MKKMLSKVKGMVAVMLVACMLLTIGGVSSDAENGVVPYGEAVKKDKGELE